MSSPRAAATTLAGLTLPALAVLAVLAPAWAPLRADQNDERLDRLFEVLATTDDPARAHATEMAIWRIWTDSGRPEVDALMAEGVDALAAERVEVAIAFFDRVVELAPGFAEGWNKRATAYYLNGQLAASVRDIERTLALEPRHFGAISGMGLIFLAKGDEVGALRAFEQVLEIHPHSLGARMRVEKLRERIRGRGV